MIPSLLFTEMDLPPRLVIRISSAHTLGDRHSACEAIFQGQMCASSLCSQNLTVIWSCSLTAGPHDSDIMKGEFEAELAGGVR